MPQFGIEKKGQRLLQRKIRQHYNYACLAARPHGSIIILRLPCRFVASILFLHGLLLCSFCQRREGRAMMRRVGRIGDLSINDSRLCKLEYQDVAAMFDALWSGDVPAILIDQLTLTCVSGIW